MEIKLVDYQSTTAAWANKDLLVDAIRNRTSGLRKNDFPHSHLDTWIGRVEQIDDVQLGEWQSRNNALATYCLGQGSFMQSVKKAKQCYSPSRIGILMGSSTASIDRTEQAYRHLSDNNQLTKEFMQRRVHNQNAPALFVADFTGITGPAITINTACSSSAKVFAAAKRWLDSEIVDAVVVGGVDTLCLSVLHGFHSLQLVSPKQCKPFDQHRDGINLGEAAGFTLLARTDSNLDDTGIRLCGYGESSDAHHISHPHPEGLGARLSIQQAMQMADLVPEQIDYINLHGTASEINDLIEGNLIGELFPKHTIATSTKAWTGHTLGAAGITEALIAIEAANHDLIPGSLNLNKLDDRLSLNIHADNIERKTNYVMSNSFGFGGNNCTLIFHRSAN